MTATASRETAPLHRWILGAVHRFFKFATRILPASAGLSNFPDELIPAEDAVRLICGLLRERGMPDPGRVRLTKLLYLLDVEMVRAHEERATDLEWVFHHYGPYAHSLEGVLARAGLETEEIELAGGRTARVAKLPGTEPRFTAFPDTRIGSVALGLTRTWGDANLHRLLNYVYFETEPMFDAKRGDPLRFDAIERRPPRAAEWKPDKKARLALAALRERLRDHLPPPLQPMARGAPPRALPETMKIWVEDEPKVSDSLEGSDVAFEPPSAE